MLTFKLYFKKIEGDIICGLYYKAKSARKNTKVQKLMHYLLGEELDREAMNFLEYMQHAHDQSTSIDRLRDELNKICELYELNNKSIDNIKSWQYF